MSSFQEPQLPVSYIIYKETVGAVDYYFAQNGRTGAIDYGGQSNAGGVDGTNASVVIQAALDALTTGRTWREKVVLRGDFILKKQALKTYCIGIPSYTFLKIEGKLTLADNQNCNMIVNKNQDTHNVFITIDGGRLDGNRVNQTSGHGIYFKHSTSPATRWHAYTNEIRNVIIHDCREDNLRHETVVGEVGTARLINLNLRNSPGYDINIINTNDILMHLVHAVDLRLYNSDGTIINESKIIGSIDMELCEFVMITGSHAESAWERNTINLVGCRECVFDGLTIAMTAAVADNSWSAIQLSSSGTVHCKYNTFSNINFRGYKDTNRYKYGIEEIDSNQDYNVYSGLNGVRIASGILKRSGINSRYDRKSIIGTIIGLSENSGIATMTSGTYQTWVTHGCALTPTIVELQGHHSEVADLIVNPSNINASQFLAEVSAPVTGDRTFFWKAEV